MICSLLLKTFTFFLPCLFGLLDVISVSGADSDPSGLHAIEPIGTAGSLVASDLPSSLSLGRAASLLAAYLV